jgi:hypothetical protein
MDGSSAGEGGEGFVQSGFLFPGLEVPGRNNRAEWPRWACSFGRLASKFIPESEMRRCVQWTGFCSSTAG